MAQLQLACGGGGLNEWPQFTTEIDGNRGRFADIRPPEPCALIV